MDAAAAWLHTGRAGGPKERITVAFGPPNAVTLADESVGARAVEGNDGHAVPGVRILGDFEGDDVGGRVEVPRSVIERYSSGKERKGQDDPAGCRSQGG